MRKSGKILLSLSLAWSLPTVVTILTQRFLPPFLLMGRSALWVYVYGIPDVISVLRNETIPFPIGFADYNINFKADCYDYTFSIQNGIISNIRGIPPQHCTPLSIQEAFALLTMVFAVSFIVFNFYRKHRS